MSDLIDQGPDVHDPDPSVMCVTIFDVKGGVKFEMAYDRMDELIEVIVHGTGALLDQSSAVTAS